ncbi:MAG: mannonate dehydratase, partial [Saprospiraceae bacterium]|nr:mannonate dehydratase [Saprospiraceae bacterium]
MKLGLGLYRRLLTDANFSFARQAGATHLVVQLVDYIKGGANPNVARDNLEGWGTTEGEHELWTVEHLVSLRRQIESHGLTLEAIENFDPAHWYDILLDGPRKREQLEDIKQKIRNIGRAGIPILGYYFSLAGVWGWTTGSTGRGAARSIEFIQDNVDIARPIPKGMVWNMRYSPQGTGNLPEVSSAEIWERYREFVREVVPVAEESGVRLVAHPDDPPLPSMRGTARLFYSFDEYEKLLDILPGSNHGMEFCMGTLQEMADGDIYELLDRHSKAGDIGYIHFRNVRGKVPHYRETFVDEGDIDMPRALRILHKNNYQGVLIPDHTPEMSCDAPWHAGMAYAL